MKKFLVGFFQIPGVEQQVVVEVPLIGNAREDYRNLAIAARKLYPKVAENQMRRVTSVIEVRDPKELSDYINPLPGLTLRQLFPDRADGGPEENTRMVGTVFFDGAHCKVTLRLHYESEQVSILLTERASKKAVQFTNKLDAKLLAKDLVKLLSDVFGPNARALEVRMKTHPEDTSTRKERVPNLKEPSPGV